MTSTPRTDCRAFALVYLYKREAMEVPNRYWESAGADDEIVPEAGDLDCALAAAELALSEPHRTTRSIALEADALTQAMQSNLDAVPDYEDDGLTMPSRLAHMAAGLARLHPDAHVAMIAREAFRIVTDERAYLRNVVNGRSVPLSELPEPERQRHEAWLPVAERGCALIQEMNDFLCEGTEPPQALLDRFAPLDE